MIGYYVSMVRNGQSRLLLGPYDTHDEALQNVSDGRDRAIAYSERHWWDAFGTCRIDAEKLPGAIFSR